MVDIFSEDFSTSNSFCKYNSLSTNKSLSPNGSFGKSFNSSLNSSLTNEDLIQDEVELQNYLKQVSQKERKSVLSSNVDQPSNLLSSFWSHPAIRSPSEVSPLLRRCAYQLAPTIGLYYLY